MSDLLTLAALVAALILGIVAVVEAHWRSWVGWGVILLAAVLIWGRVG